MSTIPKKLPVSIPDKQIKLQDSRSFDGKVDAAGQPWALIGGTYYPVKRSKVKSVSHKLSDNEPTKPTAGGKLV